MNRKCGDVVVIFIQSVDGRRQHRGVADTARDGNLAFNLMLDEKIENVLR